MERYRFVSGRCFVDWNNLEICDVGYGIDVITCWIYIDWYMVDVDSMRTDSVRIYIRNGSMCNM